MLQQMDRIYANALLTIIAASGKDASAGLPGVSETQRPPQQRVRVPGPVTLLQVPDGHWDLENSKWATRAWTYQEGYFSKKRLIFTDEQVLFVCNEMYSPESLRYPADFFRDSDWEIPKYLQSLIPSNKNSLKTLLQQIEQYSRRDLSYPGDALNGFLGVLNHYNSVSSKQEGNGIAHIHGIPVSTYCEFKSLGIFLLWRHEDPANRRYGFPSWSWAGWEGILSYDERPVVEGDSTSHIGELPISDACCKIIVEEQGRVKTALAKFVGARLYGLHQELPSSLEPRRLWVSCTVVPLEIRDVELAERDISREVILRFYGCPESRHKGLNGRLVVLPLTWKGIKVGVRAYFDQRVEQSKDMMCLLLARDHRGAYDFLMVQQVGEDEYERIGTVRLNFSHISQQEMLFWDSEGNLWEDRELDLDPLLAEYLFKNGFENKTVCLV